MFGEILAGIVILALSALITYVLDKLVEGFEDYNTE